MITLEVSRKVKKNLFKIEKCRPSKNNFYK